MVRCVNTGLGYLKLCHKCILQICLKKILNYIKFFLNGAFLYISFGCGSLVVAFEAVGCCISMGDVGVRIFCCFVGVVWYQMVSRSNWAMVFPGKTSLL